MARYLRCFVKLDFKYKDIENRCEGGARVFELDNHEAFQESFCLVLKSKKPNKVVISVPHDGVGFSGLFGGMLSQRESARTVRDRKVWPIATGIISSTENVSAIRGLMPRKYLDYNRSWPDPVNYYPHTQLGSTSALDDERLSTAYLVYHEMIEHLLKTGIDAFGNEKVLLLDLHGFSEQPEYAPVPNGYDLIFGTGNRGSILYGDVDIVMGEYLKEQGYSVFIPTVNPVDGKTDDCFAGDFTTRHHSRTSEVNAIQIEVANRFREGEDAKILGPKLVKDLSDFVNGYAV